MSRVDVIVPCYNYAHFLPACIGSIRAQEGVGIRALILDDASGDDSQKVGTELASLDPRIQYRRHLVNRGHIATYNEGIEWADGDYLLVLSADDLLTPGALGRAARLMDAHPEVGLTYGRAIMTSDPSQHAPLIPEPCRTRILTGLELIEAFCAWGGNRVPTQTAIVRTAVQKVVGGYRADLPHSGDMEMWMRFALRGSIGVVDADQAYYRVHSTNMHKSFASAVVGDMEQYRRTFDGVFDRYAQDLPQRQRLEGLARESLAKRALWKASTFLDRGDGDGGDELMKFALQTFPDVRGGVLWWRVRLKRAVGPRLWSALQRGLGRAAREAAPASTSSRIGLFPEM